MPTKQELADLLAQLRHDGASSPTMTMAEVVALSLADKVRAYRSLIRGELWINPPPAPLPNLPTVAEVQAMTAAETVGLYRRLMRANADADRPPAR